MARAEITPAYTCAVCGKNTSRLLGFAAVVRLTGPGKASGKISRHTAVLGTCASHRDQIPQRFADQAAAKGEVQWLANEPSDLRPGEVQDWYAAIDRILAEAMISTGAAPAEALIPVVMPEDVPTACPHCDGVLSWGTGPHVEDAAARDRAMAWECRNCGAAGMLT